MREFAPIRNLKPLAGFAEACYNSNSPVELLDGLLAQSADDIDCRTWDITPTEWREAIGLALRHQIADLIDDAEALRIARRTARSLD